jgi:jasmonate ZIM domain-containing protein
LVCCRPEETKATLTIFYQGQVATFHDFPADRAKDLLQMAGSVTGKAPEKGFLQMAGSVTVKVPKKGVMTAQTAVPEKAETSDEPSDAGASMPPIARKLTLQRFLRKRKNR